MRQSHDLSWREIMLSSSYGLPIGLLISDSWIVVLGVCALAVATTAVSGTHLAFWMCPIFSLSAVTALLLVIQFLGDIRVPDYGFKLLFFGFWILFATSTRRFKQLLWCRGEVWVLLTLSIIAGLMIARISWDPIEGFRKVVQFEFGEDNGSWLNNIAHSLRENGTLSLDVGISGGALLATVTTAAVLFVDHSSWQSVEFDSTGGILWRLYIWGLLTLCLLGVATFLRLTIKIKSFVRYLMLCFSILLITAIGLNEVQYGYLTALIGAVWVAASVLLAALPSDEGGMSRIFQGTGLALLVAVIGEVWFPLFAWTLLLAVTSVFSFAELWNERHKMTAVGREQSRLSRINVVRAVTGVIVGGTILTVALEGTYVSSYLMNWRGIAGLIHSGGGGGISSFGTIILLAATTIVLHQDFVSRRLLVIVLVGTTTTISIVFGIALINYPHVIGYGPSKLFRIFLLALIPLACSSLTTLANALPGPRRIPSSVLIVSVVLIASLQWGLPLQNIETIWKTKPQPYWFEAVVIARSRYPDRVPVCLDTVRGSGRSEGAYVCSRLSIGLVGGERSVLGSQLYTFQLGNICTIEPDQAHMTWSDDFFENIVIIVSDRNRLSSEAECQSRELTFSDISPFGKESVYDIWPAGWLSSIRWNLTEVIDFKGDTVQPSFDYLIKDPLDAPALREAELLNRYQSPN